MLVLISLWPQQMSRPSKNVTSVIPVSVAKVFGAFGLIAGLIVGVFYGLMLMAVSAAGGAAAQEHGGAFAALGIGAGLLVMVVTPIAAGIVQFIAGLFYGLIINLALWLAGGMELRIEQARPY